MRLLPIAAFLSTSLLALTASTVTAQAADSNDTPAPEIVVTATRLDTARESIKPALGASTYTLTNQAIQNLPGGDNQPINDIILQMPGVSQDQFGQFHVRDEHNGVQYRLNGVILPESIAVFGQTLSPRLIDKMDLVTGTLPAQYGLRTAGIIDITTKSGLKNSATFSIYGGAQGTIEPSVSLAGGSGATSWFVSGDYKHSNEGIENVNGNTQAVHDKTDQFSTFGYIDHIISDTDRIAFTGGYSNQHYQIPNPVALEPSQGYNVGGVTSFASQNLNETQLQATSFGALSLLHSSGAFSFQVSAFARLSNLDYNPDYVGELLFNGLAQYASKSDMALGAQFDSVYKLSPAHTLRAGLFFQHDRSKSWTNTNVFPTDGDVCDPVTGCQQGTVNGPPLSIVALSDVTQRTTSAYLQDEWKPLPHIVINYGLRYDDNNGQRDEHQLSPRVNMVWTPGGGFTAHAGYARYFAPAPFELVADSNLTALYNTTASPSTRANTAPYAQRENYWDLGVQQKIGRWLTLGLDGFYRRSTNLVDEGQFGAPIILTPFNYARGRIEGVEASLNYAKDHLTGYINIAHDKAQGTGITSSQYNFTAQDLAYINSHWIYLDHNQTWTGSGGAAYHWTDGALTGSRISADVVYGSGLRRTLDTPDAVPNGATLPGYVTVNLSMGHKFAGSGFDVRLDIVNLFDKVYEIRDGTGVGVGAPSYGPRRGVFVGLTKTL